MCRSRPNIISKINTMDLFNSVYEDGLGQLAKLKTTSSNSLDFNNIKTELIEIISDLDSALESVKQAKRRAASGNGNDSFPDVDSFELNESEHKLSELKSNFNKVMEASNLQGHYSDNPFSDEAAAAFDNEGRPVPPDSSEPPDQGEINEYHQQLLQEQDDLISNGLARTINNLHDQALNIGEELEYHGELIDKVEEGLDRLNFKLVNNGIKRMNKFLATNERGGNCCIAILIVVLIFVLVLLILL